MRKQESMLVDFRQAEASDALLPNPAIFSTTAWNHLHLEVHDQPAFALDEHQQTMHVMAQMLSPSSGERWLDSKHNDERRNPGDVAICPEGVTHRCNWEDPVQFMILAMRPVAL